MARGTRIIRNSHSPAGNTCRGRAIDHTGNKEAISGFRNGILRRNAISSCLIYVVKLYLQQHLGVGSVKNIVSIADQFKEFFQLDPAIRAKVHFISMSPNVEDLWFICFQLHKLPPKFHHSVKIHMIGVRGKLMQITLTVKAIG